MYAKTKNGVDESILRRWELQFKELLNENESETNTRDDDEK